MISEGMDYIKRFPLRYLNDIMPKRVAIWAVPESSSKRIDLSFSSAHVTFATFFSQLQPKLFEHEDYITDINVQNRAK